MTQKWNDGSQACVKESANCAPAHDALFTSCRCMSCHCRADLKKYTQKGTIMITSTHIVKELPLPGRFKKEHTKRHNHDDKYKTLKQGKVDLQQEKIVTHCHAPIVSLFLQFEEPLLQHKFTHFTNKRHTRHVRRMYDHKRERKGGSERFHLDVTVNLSWNTRSGAQTDRLRCTNKYENTQQEPTSTTL